MKKEVKEKNTNNGLIILCAILVIIIMVLIGITCYTIGRSNPTKAESSYETKTDKETEIKDIDALTELSTTIDLLLGYVTADEFDTKTMFSSYGFRYGVLKRDLTASDKQLITLTTAKWDKITGDKWKENKTMNDMNNSMGQYTDNYDDWFIKESHQLTEEKVNAHSVELFGEKIKTPEAQVGKCPMFIYDASQKMYYKPTPQCGGTSAGVIHSYKTKFIQKKNEAYVYMSFAYFAHKDGDYNKPMTIYKDYDQTTEALQFSQITYKNEYTPNKYVNDSINIFTEENYKEFSEYKFTFEQASNGNYYFVKVEQTK